MTEFQRVFSQKYNNITFRKAKDTDTVKIALVHYGGDKPLKIEVSYRKREIYPEEFTKINGIQVYNINSILMMKLNAFNHRDKIRDLFDITLIYNRYGQYINSSLIMMLRDAVGFKGLEQFDYLIKDQSDPLIDNNLLAENFLNMYYGLGLR